MEIDKRYSSEFVELTVKGRLDGYWADHLASALDEEIRDGSHHILLDLSQVAFLSSAGIGILVKFYRQLSEIEGSLSISKSSEQVRKIVEISGLKDVLLSEGLPRRNNSAHTGGTRPLVIASAPSVTAPIAKIEKPYAVFNVHTLAPDARLKCRLIGEPSLLETSGFAKENCRGIIFPDCSFGIGLGALGEQFEDCQDRFGEFIAAAGAVAYLPTDGTNIPDYVVAAETSMPEARICYGIVCQGREARPFSQLIRFEANKEAGSITLAQLSEACIEIAGTNRVGMVMVAESAGLIGAALRRSPAQHTSGNARFQFPGIRDWLTFTGDRAYSKFIALVAGVAVNGAGGELAPMVRPLSHADSNNAIPITGHFHAAAFSYRPLQKGDIDLKRTVRTLFERQVLQGVLHLLGDHRAMAGARQSEFVRGACWIAPIDAIAREGDAV